MSESSLSRERGEPNLVPVLDMVFQLITFFMLVVNFKTAALDMTLNLPVVGSARPVDTNGEDDVLVLNVDPEGKLYAYGTEQQLGTFVVGEATRIKKNIAASGQKPVDELSTVIVLRIDSATPFKLWQDVLKECQENGFRKFSLKVMKSQQRGAPA